MDPVVIVFLACLLLGSVVGLLAGLLGIGGGLLIVPAVGYLLVYLMQLELDIAMPMAVATSLSTILLTGFSSSRAHFKLGNLNKYIIGWCSLGIGIGATLGAQIASRISGETLKNIFALLVIAVALQMIFGGQRKSETQVTPTVLVVIGLFTGIISAMMGIGGGALLVPALLWFRVDVRQAIGCAAVSGFVIALFGTINYVYTGWSLAGLPQWSLGYVYLPAALGIVCTSVFTANWGAKLGQRMQTRNLKRIFALLLVIISIRLLMGI